MSVGIVRKVKFVNSSPGYHLFKGMVERIDRPENFKIWDFLDATCYLYVDYLNETGKLKTFVFKNQYYYDFLEGVEVLERAEEGGRFSFFPAPASAFDLREAG